MKPKTRRKLDTVGERYGIGTAPKVLARIKEVDPSDNSIPEIVMKK